MIIFSLECWDSLTALYGAIEVIVSNSKLNILFNCFGKKKKHYFKMNINFKVSNSLPFYNICSKSQGKVGQLKTFVMVITLLLDE